MRSKASLDSSREVAQGCGVSFVNYLYLVSLIIGQNFCASCAKPNQTGRNLAETPRGLRRLLDWSRRRSHARACSLPPPVADDNSII